MGAFATSIVIFLLVAILCLICVIIFVPAPAPASKPAPAPAPTPTPAPTPPPIYINPGNSDYRGNWRFYVGSNVYNESAYLKYLQNLYSSLATSNNSNNLTFLNGYSSATSRYGFEDYNLEEYSPI